VIEIGTFSETLSKYIPEGWSKGRLPRKWDTMKGKKHSSDTKKKMSQERKGVVKSKNMRKIN
tara:strand:+ start:100 stop:285 length:186 start_codon:yes stop_codon:yes gene_type:complete